MGNNKMRQTPDLAALDAFAAQAKVVSAPPSRKKAAPLARREKPVRAKVATATFYFFDEDKKRLSALVASVARHSSKKISASLLLRALILRAGDLDPEALLAAVKEMSF